MREWLLIAAMALAAPASAQMMGSYRVTPPRQPARVDYELGQVRDSIDDGRDSGQLSHREAKALRRETARVAASEGRAPDDLTEAERAEYASRREVLRAQVAAERSKRP